MLVQFAFAISQCRTCRGRSVVELLIFFLLRQGSFLTIPSPSRSASLIMSSTSSSDNFSPRFVITCRSSFEDIKPSLYLEFLCIVESLLPERLAKFVFPIGAFHLLRHHLQEFIKLDGTVSVLIHFIHHVAQFCL
ncbi:hypothetical protein ALC56_05644 [Trachymyrmex septentrionalis]|uniref:Uncharacterized protein n=1 Tax=Trachymyrmex septentrionalis TaxID=34720 RepID=A0A195FHM1_9HYME|nr:hypothetical protein ALC56_05644 [Trachymyrmex septentrionalis]